MANTIGILDTSIGGCFNGVGDVIVFNPIAASAYPTTTLSMLAGGMSLGDLYDGTVNYTGDEPTIESIKNEQGQVVYSYSEDGSFSFEATIINLNPAATMKFLNGVVLTDASLGTTTWQSSGGTHIGFGHVVATQYLPISWANREKNMIITFPRALVVATMVQQDGGVGLKITCTAQKLNTANLKTVVLSTNATPVYTA